ncbi:MAG: hypothetical protein KGI28_00335 [Thaumarchaeota archaeon]|nr:hypothetical protein [Nitrososphaerota archaeon]
MVKPIIYGAIGGGVGVAIIVVVLFVLPHSSQQYGLSVDSRTEMVMGVGNVVRVYVQNTGSSQVTNIKIDYGTTSDNLPALDPGQKIMFSPPSGTKMVTVTDDQGDKVVKPISDSM